MSANTTNATPTSYYLQRYTFFRKRMFEIPYYYSVQSGALTSLFKYSSYVWGSRHKKVAR